MARNSKKAVVVEDELDELEEIEEVDEDEKPAPKKKGRKAKVDEDEKPAKKSRRSSDDEESSAYGAAWLAEYVNEQTGKEYTAANIRVLLRKLAADGTLDRAVGEDRSRYAFTGPNDPIVKAVIKHVKAGALEQDKADRLAAVKEKGKAKKAAKAAPVEDDDEDEEETPAPKKKATRRR